MVVAGVSLIHSLGITKKELIPLANGVSTADNAGLGMIGGILVKITGKTKGGELRRSNQLCYIAENIHCLFLSKQCCQDLGIIPVDFPKIGSFPASDSANLSQLSSSKATTSTITGGRPCKCPDRSLPPDPPTKLPMPATEENRENGSRNCTAVQPSTSAPTSSSLS